MRKYTITAVFLLLLTTSVILLASPADTESILAENREPQSLPVFSLKGAASGKYMAEIDDYIDDNIGFRSKLMNISDKIQSCFGFVPGGMGKVISTTKDIGTGESQDSRLVLYQNNIMEMFTKNEEIEDKYASSLNKVRASLPDGVSMYSMLIPTRLEFCESLYSDAEDSQKEAIDRVYGKLNWINKVNVYDRLGPAVKSGNEYTYFMTDHHWTMDGAYHGYEAFMETTGNVPYQKTDFPKIDVGNFYGSLYLKAKSQLSNQIADTLSYYDVSAVNNFSIKMRAEDAVTEYAIDSPVFYPQNGDYKIFFGGDNPLMEITNNSIADGKNLLVLKDSYANAMLPWLINNYKTVIVIDPRSFRGNILSEIARYNINEVAVINYVFTTTFSDYCDMITNLIK